MPNQWFTKCGIFGGCLSTNVHATYNDARWTFHCKTCNRRWMAGSGAGGVFNCLTVTIDAREVHYLQGGQRIRLWCERIPFLSIRSIMYNILTVGWALFVYVRYI